MSWDPPLNNEQAFFSAQRCVLVICSLECAGGAFAWREQIGRGVSVDSLGPIRLARCGPSLAAQMPVAGSRREGNGQ